MERYKTKIKAQINLYKEVEVLAENEMLAKKQIMELSSNLLDNCRKVIEENDKDIKRYMSYWDYNKIEEVKCNS